VIVAAALALAADDAHAASTTLTVNWARDNKNDREFYAGSPEGADPLDRLNSASSGDKVDVDDKVTEWWEARFTNPNPGIIGDGGYLISVKVTVQYMMGRTEWNGSLNLEARRGAALLGTMSLPEYAAATQETWDLTGLLNAQADPLAALNDLSVRMVNDDPVETKKVRWSHAKVDVVFRGPPAVLVFEVEPSSAHAGADIQPGVAVAIKDAWGDAVTNATNRVTLSISSNPGGGVLSGGTNIDAAGGVAVFSDLSIDSMGSGYALVCTSPGLVSAMSVAFDVVVQPPEDFNLLAPSSGEEAVPPAPDIEWEAADYADTYALEVAEDASFLVVVVDEAALSGTTYTPAADTLQPETSYYWRVTASNTTGDTPAANNDLSFTTRPQPLLTVTPSDVFFSARPGSAELVRRNVIVTNSGPAGSVAEVTVAWATPPGCDVAISNASFTLAAGESMAITLVLDPAAAALTRASFDADLDVSAKESSSATDTVRVSVDFEPYGVDGIGCSERARGSDEGARHAAPAFLAPVLLATMGLFASRQRRKGLRK
jgi:hypothetical protein